MTASSNSIQRFVSGTLYNIAAVFAAIFVLGPLSIVWNYISLKSEWGLATNERDHARSVAQIQRQVKHWASPGGGKDRGQKMTTARPSWKSISTTKTNKSSYYQVDVNLGQIVKLDVVNKTVTVEPSVVTGQLSRYLIKRGWTIPMIPELETLSIGGLICGTGIESSSHKLGLFHDTVLSYEIVLPTGKVVTCSKENDPELFYSIPGSFATIGFLTAITFPLIPAKRYVKLDYRSVSSLKEFQTLLKSEPNHDFVEGLALSKDKIVVMFGDLDNGNNPTIRVSHINRWFKPLFHRHAETILNTLDSSPKSSSFVEYIPLLDYYHRHSRATFWVLEKTTPFFYSRIMLFLTGWIHPVNGQLQVILRPSVFQYFLRDQIIQDYIVPMERADEFFEAGDKLLKIYPVWLCPVEMKKTGAMFPSVGNGDYIDIGYYGYAEANGFHRVNSLKALEKFCIKCNGFQLLYAECFMSKQEFHEMYDTSVYKRVRKEHECEPAFPDVYDKVGPKARNLDKLQSS